MQLPNVPLEFTTSGDVAKPDQLDAAVALAQGQGQSQPPTHVICLCHGWNNTIQEAEAFYTRLADKIAQQQEQQSDPSVRFAVIALLWPSVRWADEGGSIAGGGLAVTDPAAELMDRIDTTVLDAQAAAELKAHVPGLNSSHDARVAFVETLRQKIVPPPDAVADDDPIPSTFLEGDVEGLFDDAGQGFLGVLASSPLLATDAGSTGGSSGGSTGGSTGAATGLFGNGISPVVLARFLLNMGTYYTMKGRAGTVGSNGVAHLLQRLGTEANGVSVSLVGHSFGARVVSAAAGTGAPAHAICLLQGAFSQFGFDDEHGPLGKAGAFRRAVQGGSVDGPIVVTHSQKDLAVRLAYAIASRIALQTASALGDKNDPYGGLGANGAVGLPRDEVDETQLGPVGTTYVFAPRRVHNLVGDSFITGHSAVDGPEVANAVRQALLA